MKIHPNDWVLYTLNPCGNSKYTGGKPVTQCFMFHKLPEDWQYRLNRIYGHYHYSYHSLPVGEIGLRLHAVFLPEGWNSYGYKLDYLYKYLDKPTFSLENLNDITEWKQGVPVYHPASLLNGTLGYESKKIVMTDYLRVITEHLEEPKRFYGPYTEDQKHTQEIKDLLKQLKLEGRPMKATEKTKKFLVELHSYDMEKKKIGEEREYVSLTTNSAHPTNSTEITKYVEHSLVDYADKWCLTHDILVIKEGHYKITSGHIDHTEERLDILSNHGEKQPLADLDMTKSTHYYLKYKYQDGKTGEEVIYTPVGVSPEQVLGYYQGKYPNNNYELSDKPSVPTPKGEEVDNSQFNSSKVVTKETIKRKQELPKKGETPAKNTRKVCYKHALSDKVYRDEYKKVKRLVEDDKDYEFVSKKAWKTQRVGHKTNIILPITGNLADLGQRRKKREERELKRKLAQTTVRSRPPTVGFGARVIQGKKDHDAYVDKLASEGKKPKTHLIPRCYQAVILGPQGAIEDTINIKAVNEAHAELKLGELARRRKKLIKLNGVVKSWIKQTGKNRK